MKADMKKAVVSLLAGLFLVATAAWANTDGKVLEATDATGFQVQSKVIKQELADGKTYSELDEKQRADVLAALDRIGAALAAHGNVDAMHEDVKVRLFNDQELVNTVLTKGREDSRLLCERETPVGSHRPVTHCMTVAERRRIRERTQDFLQKGFQGQALDPSH